MPRPSLLIFLATFSDVLESAITAEPLTPTAVVPRQIFSTANVASCSTVSGLAAPQPSGSRCGTPGGSDGTGYIISYVAGSPYVANIAACGQICLQTSNCKNVYFTPGVACNLHNTSTLIPNSASTYKFYDASCFSCITPPQCAIVSGLAAPQPSGSRCGTPGGSDGTGYIISYVAGSPYVANIGLCGQICLQTSTCENVYFTPGVACNLHNTSTLIPNSASTYKFYDSSCFTCSALNKCAVVSGFASPQPANTICNQKTEPSGGGLMVSYTSGIYIVAPATCGKLCAQTAGCTNIYFETNALCSLYSSVPTNVPTTTSIHTFYELRCFTCAAVVYTSSSSTISSTSSIVSSSSSSVSTSSIPSVPLWTFSSIQKNPLSYNLTITTTYTQSPQCTQAAITQMDAYGPYLWQNSVNPLPNQAVTTCYPSQFYSSILGNLNNIKLPAFSALTCPSGWDTYSYNTTYIGCCPRSFVLQAPNYLANPARPFSDAICASNIGVSGVYDVKWYNSTAYWTDLTVTAATGTVIYADAFNGFTTPATVSASVTKSTTTSAT